MMEKDGTATPTSMATPATLQDETTGRAALVALYNATDGARWKDNTNWLSEAPVGEWHGVTTDTGGHVTEVSLYDNQLTGPIPAELGNLPGLQSLILYANQLTGPIPPELGDLANLQELNLSGNQLDGAIPPELGNLTGLQSLILIQNELIGPIPPELGNLASLQLLALDINRLSGEIPPELGNLANLEGLSLSGNQLSGVIPPELGNLANLEGLSLSGNQLSGVIPAELGNLANLVALQLLENQLTGPIPPQFGNLSKLQHLSLTRNQMTGEIPPELGNLTSLRILFLTWNEFTGCIPAELQDWAQVASGLPFCGEADQPESVVATLASATDADRAALIALYNATGGADWRINDKWLSEAPIGEWLGVTTNSDGRVTDIDLNNNQLTGPIPPELGNLTMLRSLNLFYNRLTAIPPELGNLANLEELQLSGNQLTGPIPPELGNLAKLQRLDFTQNQLTGPIPSELGNLADLTGLFLHINQLTGEVPTQLGSLANLQRLSLSGNELTGCIPTGLQGVKIVDAVFLDLPICGQPDRPAGVAVAVAVPVSSVGEASGDSSTDRAALASLYNATGGANWKNNDKWLSEAPMGEWHGVTTDSDGRVIGIDLNNNQLTGAIPLELGNLTNLKRLNLSGNEWTGCISTGSQIDEIVVDSPVSLCGESDRVKVEVVAEQVASSASSSDAVDGGSGTKLSVSPKIVYLDQELAISGSGFPHNERVFVFLDLGGNFEPVLGLVDSDEDGSWSLRLRPLGGQNSVKRNAATILAHGTVTVKARSRDGGTASTPLHVMGGEAPASGDPSSDRVALVALYNATDGANWKNNDKWVSDAPVGEWAGVTTNDSGRVTKVSLESNQLTGTIPPELGNLANLEWLVLEDNQLSGLIPPELGNLGKLQVLFLGQNPLGGAIPSELGNLINLITLYLIDNRLTGTIPVELGELTLLKNLFLRGNELTGCIPAGLQDLQYDDFDLLELPLCTNGQE